VDSADPAASFEPWEPGAAVDSAEPAPSFDPWLPACEALVPAVLAVS
jgi:hypothetical protein